MAEVGIESCAIGVRRAAAGRFAVSEVVFAGGTVIGRHSHPRGCLAVVVNGRVRKTYSRVAHEAVRGDVVTLPDEEPHSDIFGLDGATLVVVEAERFFSQTRAFVDDAALALAHRIRQELSRSDAFTPLALEGLALELTAQQRRSLNRHTQVDDAAETLRSRFREPPTLEELAAEVGLSAGELARCFRVRFKQSVGAYLRSARLEWAAGHLIRTDAPLAQIACEAGFADQSHFTRCFAARYGVPPGRYRTLHGFNNSS